MNHSGMKSVILTSLCIFYIFNIAESLPTNDSRRLTMCNLQINVSETNVMECKVNKGRLLDYRDLRNWSEKEQTRKFSVRINCDGGLVYLPWPFKARNVISLEVNRCSVLGFMSELTMELNIPDELKTLVLSDVSVEIPFQEMLQLRQRIDQVPRSTDCGQLTLEKLVLKGMHYDLKMSPEERDGFRKASFADNAHHHSNARANDPCVYTNLKYIDESGSRKSGHYHLKLIPEYSKFPSLEIYNMSGNEMNHVPTAFRHLHSGKFPALRHIDFSNNFLRTFEFDLPNDPTTCRLETVDLHNNQINSISADITKQLKNIGNIFVDLRKNPLRCNCRLESFRQYIEGQYLKAVDIEKRKRVAGITCLNGSRLQGKMDEISLLNSTFNRKCQR